MKIFLENDVYEAALVRLRWLFDEFEHVIVDFSGGKDSTIMVNLALQVAEEKGRLPIDVLFIDQEAEWAAVIDYARHVMSDPRVNPYWLQVPIRLFNATSTAEPWLYCWEPGQTWIREKEPNSYRENVYGTDRFKPLFPAFTLHQFPHAAACHISGVRTEESPARRLGLTSMETYKGETWGRIDDRKRGHYTFYPIYDWSYSDVWKAIHDHGWEYCRTYDYMYQYGVQPRNMRVSNVHHETAVNNLFFLQEIEAETWEKITKRIAGINTVGQLQTQWHAPKTLPPMFRDWLEYRDHLLDNLIEDQALQAHYRTLFQRYESQYNPESYRDLVRRQIETILANDYHGTKLSNFASANLKYLNNRGKRSGRH